MKLEENKKISNELGELVSTDFKKITISLAYYNDENNIERHINQWAKYADLVLFQIIDVGSTIPAEDILMNFDLSGGNIRLFRIEKDIPWNIPGVRNLGGTVCSTPWMLLCDMDQTFERTEIEKMCRLPDKGNGYFYSFARQNNKKSTMGTMLVSLEDYWRGGGFDEDLSGNYGYEDILFRHQLKYFGIKEIICKEIICTQHIANCALDKSTKVNAHKMEQKITELPRQNWDVLRFKWKQVQMEAGSVK